MPTSCADLSDIEEILGRSYFGNTAEDYCWLVGLILLGFILQRWLSKLASNLIYKLLKKYSEGIGKEKFFGLMHRPIAWFLMLCIIYLASDRIEFPAEWGLAPGSEFGIRMIIHKLYLIFMIGSATWVITRIVDFIGLIMQKKAEKTETMQDDQIVPFVVEAVKIVVIIFAVFFGLATVFHVNIGALVAGLGIGGLAIALAARESLENLFGSFTIFFDKPFTVGDMITISGTTGTVEKVGFRSTRIRTLKKSYVTIPNRNMVNAELDNLTFRTFRRVDQTIGILYGTPMKKVQAIVSDIQQYIEEHPHTNQDGQVRFMEFGESSMDIMVQYFIDTMEWEVFLEVKEEINYKIMEIVEKHKSDFAFPTRTVHMEKG